MREINLKLKIDKDDFKKRLDIKDGINGVDGKDGQNGSPDTPEQIVDKLESLPKTLDYNKLKNLPNIEAYLARHKQASKTVSLQELDDVDLSQATITNGKYVIPAAGGGGGGTVDSVVAGTGIDVDNTDPANPIVGVDNTIATKAFAVAMAIALS